MSIHIQIDPTLNPEDIEVRVHTLTPEVQQWIAQYAEERMEPLLLGFSNDQAQILDPDQVLRIYAEDGKVYASSEQGRYQLRSTLSQLEKQLAHTSITRISRSELVNLRQVKAFDFNWSGTIMIHLRDGSTTFAARRQIPLLKQKLGL